MFNRSRPIGQPVHFTFDGRPLQGSRGDTVALALLAAGIMVFRQTPRTGSPRGPYCLVGQCFECLVEINGRANCQACMIRLEEGMTIRPQRGAKGIAYGEG
jgi:predicted molibdopterin-dependent oxidoreductase YjgC